MKQSPVTTANTVAASHWEEEPNLISAHKSICGYGDIVVRVANYSNHTATLVRMNRAAALIFLKELAEAMDIVP